jgi:ABC-type transport system substrate-binding protein
VIVSGLSTLTFRLPAPDPRFFDDLASLVPVPPGTTLHDVGTKPLPSTGPYVIQSYVPGRLLTLVRNRYFHIWSEAARPDGYPDEIVYRVLTNPTPRAVLAGKTVLAGAGRAFPPRASMTSPPAIRVSSISIRSRRQRSCS